MLFRVRGWWNSHFSAFPSVSLSGDPRLPEAGPVGHVPARGTIGGYDFAARSPFGLLSQPAFVDSCEFVFP